MILRALYDYADRSMELLPAGYAHQHARYLVEVGGTEDGSGCDNPPPIVDTTADGGRAPRLLLPRLDVQRSSGVKPVLLADNGEYAFAIPREGAAVSSRKHPQTVVEDIGRRHASFLGLLKECLDETSDEAVAAVLAFYERLGAPLAPQSPGRPPQALMPLLPADYDASARVSFTYGGEPVADRESVRLFWASRAAKGSSSEVDDLWRGQCMVTGEVGPVVDKMPGTVRGLPGTLPTGAKLVSFNRPSFESHGFKSGQNAALSPQAARKIDAALAELLSRPELRFFCGSTTYLFWSAGASESAPVGSALRALIHDPSSLECLNLLEALVRGGFAEGTGEANDDPHGVVDPERFYSLARELAYAGEPSGGPSAESAGALNVLALAGRSARVSIRSFSHASVPQMLAAAGRFVLAQRVVDFGGNLVGPGNGVLPARGMAELAAATVTPGSDPFANPRTADSMVRCATGEAKLSEELLGALARRGRRGAGGLSPTGVQLAKIALVSKGVISMEDLTSLEHLPEFEDSRDEEAYHLGRLLAQLESIQRLALERDVSANLATKYYGLASSAPSVGFSQPLTKVNRAHLPRLYRRRRGLYFRLKSELDEILARLPTPLASNLGLQRQLLFDLGYRHQEARNRAVSLRRGAQTASANGRRSEGNDTSGE